MIHRPTTKPHGNRKDFDNIKRLFPYIWDFKGRVLLALSCLILSKVAIVGMPLMLKDIVDGLDSKQMLAMDDLELLKSAQLYQTDRKTGKSGVTLAASCC